MAVLDREKIRGGSDMTRDSKLLHCCRAESMSLGETITQCQSLLGDAVALLYSPQSCQWARVSDSKLLDSRNEEIDVSGNMSFFEARVFNSEYELRWLNRIDGIGNAALILDSPQENNINEERVPRIEGFVRLDPVECYSLEQKYLLWGKKAQNQPEQEGWQRLAEARIGKSEIPISDVLVEKQRINLVALEYLSNVDDEYGNFAVIEERLLKLEVASL